MSEIGGITGTAAIHGSKLAVHKRIDILVARPLVAQPLLHTMIHNSIRAVHRLFHIVGERHGRHGRASTLIVVRL